MKKIVLGVTSSISIYKACEILRGFQKRGFEVQVVMTRNAERLISSRLFSALSREKTIVDFFEEDEEKIGHVALADEASLFLVAPATANIIGKFASGVADDALTTLYLALRCPVLIAPAMNEAMYLHPQTQENILKLRRSGVDFVLPEEGYLACRDEGWGRLAAPEKIVERGLSLLQKSVGLKGKTFLITAGPTREPIDPVRFLSNRSSGKMGFELAAEAIRRKAKVILVSGPTYLIPPFGAVHAAVETAEEMEREVMRNFPRADVIIMAAAVADFKFRGPSTRKLKKQDVSSRMELVRTGDILEKLSLKRGRAQKIVVGFAAETHDLVANAVQKMKKKRLDLIVANNVAREGIGFESDFNDVAIIDKKGAVEKTGKLAKSEISRIILDRVGELLEKKG